MSVNEVFKPFWDWRILSCNYNTFEGIVTLILQEPESENTHKINFYQVSSYFFLQNTENKFLYDSYNEMSSISFEEEIIESKSIKQKWLKEYLMDFNVIIGIIRSTLLIKAEMVEVDSVMYNLEV